jgi:hypothetical protein
MKPVFTNHFSRYAIALAGLFLLSGNSIAQQSSESQPKGKKTITIHVTKEVDGDVLVIDTTVITDGDFDADSFLMEKGILDDNPGYDRQMDKKVIIRHPNSQDFSWNESERGMADTVFIDSDTVIVLTDNFETHPPSPPLPGMIYDYNFDMPDDFPPMQSPQLEEMLEGFARSFGIDDVMPFGEMKQVVVKKKRHGKKIIITFEDRDKADIDEDRGNRKKEEKVIIYKNGDMGKTRQNEDRVGIEGQQGEKVIIHKNVETNGEEKIVTITTDVDDSTPVKKGKKVIIIKEEKTK